MDSFADIIERFINFTAWEMTKPKAYGPFHLIFTFVGLAVLIFLAWKLRNISERGNKILLISVSVFLMVTELYNLYKEMGVNKTSLMGSGNGIRKNKPFIKLTEEKFGSPLKIPAHKEEAAYGAALFGAICKGYFKNAAEAQKLIKYE